MLTETRGVKFILDLTDQRAAEAAARQERERRDRLEREFVANAAHELRTPLAAIITSVDALNRGAKDDPLTRERFLGHLQRQSQRLARLSDSLLLLAQAESLHRPERVRFAVRPLLEDVAAELQLPEGVTAHVTAPSTLEVLAHRGLVERIVANLLDNAVKHTAAGRIELRSRATPAGVLIEVRDTGSGISEETRQRSFDRFYRGQARSSDGFGLGLSIAMQAAAALDAEIEITPRRGGGTVARLVLPTNPASDEPVIAAGDVS
jgi:signal transduction histidine kinase